ncbi:hypothetical protein BD769DRAFT_1383420 [Suillus cothurnatus]|nr:hypothetical protein BD769DRAFT_1383420 [Suillus cothurnatus]
MHVMMSMVDTIHFSKRGSKLNQGAIVEAEFLAVTSHTTLASAGSERTWELFPIAVGVFCVKLWVEDIPVVIQRSQTAIHQIDQYLILIGDSAWAIQQEYFFGQYSSVLQSLSRLKLGQNITN